ncbi:hypothetical protein LJR034_009296 [Caballeronia sp. LjRoot34]|uniref:hypothetical protein n=1 Tax=Caballeronia sp. LjRoot34 TaxID=3342325 RepID=UPI003ECC874B
MASIYVCFADRLKGVRSDVLGPFSEVDMTYNSLLVASVDGSEDLISSRVAGLDVWVYGGIEYSTVLFVDSPDAESVSYIAINANDD